MFQKLRGKSTFEAKISLGRNTGSVRSYNVKWQEVSFYFHPGMIFHNGTVLPPKTASVIQYSEEPGRECQISLSKFKYIGSVCWK